MPKRGRNLRGKKARLGSGWGGFWVVLGGPRVGVFVDFILVFLVFPENLGFRCCDDAKTVWGRHLVENATKLGSQNDPKTLRDR